MIENATHLGQVSTVVVPDRDQAAVLAFYVETLGTQKVNYFTYPTGERWVEVSRQGQLEPVPRKSSA